MGGGGAWREGKGDACVVSPAEVNGARTIGSFLDERLVKLASGTGVDHGPAVLAVVLSFSNRINNHNGLI